MATIDDLLAANAQIAPEMLAECKEHAKEKNITYLHALEEKSGAPVDVIVKCFSQHLNVQVAKIGEMEIPENIIKLIPRHVARGERVIPIDRAGNNIILATGDPKNFTIQTKIRQSTGYTVKPVLASEMQISVALEKYYGEELDIEQFAEEAAEQTFAGGPQVEIRKDISGVVEDDGPIINLVNKILTLCMSKKASDIHIEPYENDLRVRLRIDGTLAVVAKPPVQIKDALASRIKIMAGINIAEKRLPQDGGIRVTVNDSPIDFRVNTLPTIHGEKIVMRILDKSNLQVDMTQLGFEKDDLEKLLETIHRPYGMVLVTGPTGSGKTTTLYSALAELNKSSENIMTAEDPVEYNLAGINQVQVKDGIGLTFSSCLRAFLRQDPDIIMVGEIRDLDTAEIAIKAALTGHMVLSTLHTNSAADTVVRLLNMGVESFNLVSSLNAVVAQRLAKKICDKCRVVDESVTPEMLVQLGIHPAYANKVKAYKGQGCAACGNQGMRGRVAVQEVMVINDPIRDAIVKNLPAGDIKRIAMQTGMKTLRQTALNKLAQGIMNAAEVVKNTNADTDVGTPPQQKAS